MYMKINQKMMNIHASSTRRCKFSCRCNPSMAVLMAGDDRVGLSKRRKVEYFSKHSDLFEQLPDDIVRSVLSKLCSSADCPADFISVVMTCKRLNCLSLQSTVLSKASQKTLAVKATKWSESAERFLKRCADAGSVEACFILGMIRFYCLPSRGSGAALMAKAAASSHAAALYSLAVIHFNGSGGSKSNKNLGVGFSLCWRAAVLATLLELVWRLDWVV